MNFELLRTAFNVHSNFVSNWSRSEKGCKPLGETEATKRMMRVGFEPTPFRTRSLVWRLRPLGHLTVETEGPSTYKG